MALEYNELVTEHEQRESNCTTAQGQRAGVQRARERPEMTWRSWLLTKERTTKL